MLVDHLFLEVEGYIVSLSVASRSEQSPIGAGRVHEQHKLEDVSAGVPDVDAALGVARRTRLRPVRRSSGLPLPGQVSSGGGGQEVSSLPRGGGVLCKSMLKKKLQRDSVCRVSAYGDVTLSRKSLHSESPPFDRSPIKYRPRRWFATEWVSNIKDIPANLPTGPNKRNAVLSEVFNAAIFFVLAFNISLNCEYRDLWVRRTRLVRYKKEFLLLDLEVCYPLLLSVQNQIEPMMLRPLLTRVNWDAAKASTSRRSTSLLLPRQLPSLRHPPLKDLDGRCCLWTDIPINPQLTPALRHGAALNMPALRNR
ncbi:hypothetical protein AAG570_003226 [Ranatra chinensis]|uniref:Uncharacterized protein n=1 Tax=Ranatra chinensis TaxID=642074 RepID=A0ABD0Y6S4_9HEMI